MRRFNTLYPDIRVVIDDCAPDQFVSRVIGEHVDFGIGTPERAGADVDTQTLVRDHLSLVCTQDHPLAARKTLRWADLAQSSWVLPPRETLVRQAFMTAFLNDGATPPMPVVEALSSVTVGAVLRRDPSLLCAVRLEHAIDEIARGGVRRLAIAPKVSLPSFGLFFRRDGME
eukprot:gene4987-5927_t